jgi:hypothetical protein
MRRELEEESVVDRAVRTSVGSQRGLVVFLCHASADKPVVRKVHRRLKQDGFAPWLNEVDLIGGQDWDLEIRKAIGASDVVVVCLSQQSVKKRVYVQKEIRRALDIADELPAGSIFLIPVRLDECELPEQLHQWQRIDLFTPTGYDDLVRSLRTRRAELDSRAWDDLFEVGDQIARTWSGAGAVEEIRTQREK